MIRRRGFRLCLLATALAALGGCVRMAPPAPVELRGGPGPAAAAAARSDSPAAAPIAHPDSVKVASGDTLYGVARRYGLPVRALIDANHLAPPYALRTGTTLSLPQLRTHTVRSGDTLYSIARLYGVDVSTLARSNHLEAPYTVRTGTLLILPSAAEPAVAASVPAVVPPQPVISAPLPPVASAPLPPARTPPAVSAAAQNAGSSVPSPALKAAEGIAPRTNTAATGPTKAPAAPAVSTAPAAAPAPSAEERVAVLPPPLQSPAKGFLWPVRGRVIAAYGEGPGGTHNDGINIAAAAGTPVVAAAAGVVAYAGNELRGYGNLVLIKHDDGFMTAYAHNSVLLVKRGDHVLRGQVIARVGATGAVSAPQLHFELRRGTRALDPLEFLPAAALGTASG